MLYDEFIQGTGCKVNDHNYKVYKDLEILYMNSDLSKAEIYEYGKKLVDNSKSPEQIAQENAWNEQIADLKAEIKRYQDDVKRYTEYHKEEENFYGRKETYWLGQAKWARQLIKDAKRRIADIKWIMAI